MKNSPQKPASVIPVVIIFFLLFAVVIASVSVVFYLKVLPILQKDPLINSSGISSKLMLDLITKTKKNFADGDYAQQLVTSESALANSKTDKEKAISYYWRGLAKYKLAGTGNKTDAQNDLIAATQLDPTYAGPYVTLSAIQMDSGNFGEGLKLAQKCAELDPKYAWCENNIGLALINLNRKLEGIQHLEKAVSLSPDTYVFRDNLKRAKEAN